MNLFLSWSNAISSWVVPALFLFIVVYASIRRVRLYEVFVEGAKEGFTTAVMIIPYLVAILSAIAIFRSSGLMKMIADNLNFEAFPSEAVMLSLIKPLSGSGARGVMLDIFGTHGVDSFHGFLASTIQGSTETTFYVIAVYFGAVGVKNTRHTVPVGLGAELTAIIVSAIIANLWFASLQ